MTKQIFHPFNGALSGTLDMIGDKSISHRAIIFGAMAEGTTYINNLLECEDTLRTMDIFKQMGVSIQKQNSVYTIQSRGVRHFKQPTAPLYFGNSGTTARLVIGLLSGLPFETTVTGDASLMRRPMDRVIEPLTKMGAKIKAKQGKYLPLMIEGQSLTGYHHQMKVKSAQVKSAVLLAGLLASGQTTIKEPTTTRNHTELMMTFFGLDLLKKDKTITLSPNQSWKGAELSIPGDISAASFWLVAALITPNSQVRLNHVGLNDSRTGILDVLKTMGAKIEYRHINKTNGEKSGDMFVENQSLTGVIIEGQLIPRLIDEIPIIALLATQAEGQTVIRHAEELKVKETDRIQAVVNVLSTLGANITATSDGMIINGPTMLTGGEVSAYGDHRIAMMIVIASLIAKQKVTLDDASSIAISYPRFFKDLDKLTRA